MNRSYTSHEFTQLQTFHTNVADIARSRTPKFLARLQKPPQAHDVLPFQQYAARNKLFAKFETLIEELIETKLLLSDQLCSVCDKYDWTIPPGADDLRINALQHGHARKVRPDAKLGEDSFLDGFIDSEPTTEPVWLADSLPSGSLFQVLTRPKCRICMLVLHLLSPLPIKSLLSWALDQPLSVLQDLQYSMHYRIGEEILVKMKQPLSDLWQDAGCIEMVREDNDSTEQSLVWQSSKLSRRRRLNSSWIHSTSINYPLVKYWLRRCNEYHEHCHISRSHGRKDMNIRLIDVVDQCIIHGTLAYRYFALSYVWGGVERLKATKDNIAILEQKNALRERSPSLPRTVQDAITFVARIDQRYLWVDSLCIVQDDHAEKHSQIANMHEIYSAAYATIVQHSGRDANAGLPGVRPGSRSLVATKTHVGNVIMMAKANYSTPKVLSSSIHSTRGWTLQEVILSNRCLHFFDKHLTFVCGEEWAQDWNTQYNDEDPATLVTPTELTRVSSHMLWQMNPLSFARVVDGPMWDSKTLGWLRYFEIYARILTEFTARHLSYDSDSLPAFYGLGGAVTRINNATFHFGIPSNSFDLALLWINLGPGERRKEKHEEKKTPSWSWAAWTGQSTYNLCELSGEPSKPYMVNSYVRRYYVVVEQGRSVEIKRFQLANGRPSTADQSTPYFEAHQGTAEPPMDLKKAERWPEGCLHFWAEESPMDQLYFTTATNQSNQSVNFLLHRTSDKHCGIFALPSNISSWNSLELLSGPEYSLILMSESHQVLPHWIFGASGALVKTRLAYSNIGPANFGYEPWYFDGVKNRTAWMFNVLLVKRVGAFVERVAFGQVHMLAWLEMKRRRRYIRMI